MTCCKEQVTTPAFSLPAVECVPKYALGTEVYYRERRSSFSGNGESKWVVVRAKVKGILISIGSVYPNSDETRLLYSVRGNSLRLEEHEIYSTHQAASQALQRMLLSKMESLEKRIQEDIAKIAEPLEKQLTFLRDNMSEVTKAMEVENAT